ncbi:MAG: hypothetical protein V3T49_04105 [Dehalococcoidia bacterium]
MNIRLRYLVIPAIVALGLSAMACGGGDSNIVAAAEIVSQPTSTTEPIIAPDPTSVPSPKVAPTAPPAPTPTLTAKPTSTAVPLPTSTTIPTATPTAAPTTTPYPTQTQTPIPTVQPTATTIPTATPTIGPPTPIPTPAPVGYSFFAGKGTDETDVFVSPPQLPWIIEWEAEGTGPNILNVTLMDPHSDTVVNGIVDDSGTGQIGGANLVPGNMGSFYLLVEGPEEGWTIWIYQVSR